MNPDVTHLRWVSPYSFVRHPTEVPADVLSQFGLYILAIRHQSKYYAYNPGLTGGTDKPHLSFRERLGSKLKECETGLFYLYDPVETLRTGRLPQPIDQPRVPGFDRVTAGAQRTPIFELFLASCEGMRRARIEEIELAIHRHFKWLHRHRSVFARLYDEAQEPQSGPGPDSGDHPVCSVFERAVIAGLGTVRVDPPV